MQGLTVSTQTFGPAIKFNCVPTFFLMEDGPVPTPGIDGKRWVVVWWVEGTEASGLSIEAGREEIHLIR